MEEKQEVKVLTIGDVHIKVNNYKNKKIKIKKKCQEDASNRKMKKIVIL